MKRDKKGRFSKKEDENDGYNLNLALPSFRSLLCWLIIIVILLQWRAIFARFSVLKKFSIFLRFNVQKRRRRNSKKSGLFY